MNRQTVVKALVDLMERKAESLNYSQPYSDRSGLTGLMTIGCGCCSSEALSMLDRNIVLEPADKEGDLSNWDITEKVKEIIEKELTDMDLMDINCAYIMARMKVMGLRHIDLDEDEVW